MFLSLSLIHLFISSLISPFNRNLFINFFARHYASFGEYNLTKEHISWPHSNDRLNGVCVCVSVYAHMHD